MYRNSSARATALQPDIRSDLICPASTACDISALETARAAGTSDSARYWRSFRKNQPGLTVGAGALMQHLWQQSTPERRFLSRQWPGALYARAQGNGRPSDRKSTRLNS